MQWSTPIDGQYSMYVYGPALALAAIAATAALFGVELARRKVPIAVGHGAAMVGLLAAFVGALVAVIVAIGPGTPPWEHDLLAAAGAVSWLRSAASVVATALSFPFALMALFLLALWPMRKSRWGEAYFALAAGPGLAAILVVLKVVFPRDPPAAQPFFVGATGFPNDAAALVPMAAMLALLLSSRLLSARRRLWPWLATAAAAAVVAPVVAGTAWPSDVVAGAALAGAWFITCWMGLQLAQGATPGSALERVLDRLDTWMRSVVEKPVPWLLGLIGFGIALRLASYWWTPLAVDAYSYAAMSHGFLENGSFTMAWGDVHTYHTVATSSHHYPPLYPLFLSGFFAAIGFSASTLHIASIASSLGAILVTYLCSRDLYGRVRGLAAAAIVAVSPLLVQNTGQGYSENLVLLLFVATLWAILKSLEKPWYIVPAGLLAGLGYLTKSTMGPFFIIAGLGGLAWRLHWKGWKVLRDPAYITAILCFGALVAFWAARNILLFGTWDTSAHITAAYHAALADPLRWGYLFLVTLVFYATVGYMVYLALLAWIPRLARIPKLASEHDSGLWLALGLPLLLTATIDACLWLIEDEFFLNNVRYVAFVTVPAVWLLLRHADGGNRGVRLATLLTVALLVAGSAYFAKPTESYTQQLADDLGAKVQAGDSIAFVDNNNHFAYRFYFQLTDNGERHVSIIIACMTDLHCPLDAPRVGSLNTTWVLLPHYAEIALPDHYVQVHDTIAQYDGSHPTLMTLWRHT